MSCGLRCPRGSLYSDSIYDTANRQLRLLWANLPWCCFNSNLSSSPVLKHIPLRSLTLTCLGYCNRFLLSFCSASASTLQRRTAPSSTSPQALLLLHLLPPEEEERRLHHRLQEWPTSAPPPPPSRPGIAAPPPPPPAEGPVRLPRRLLHPNLPPCLLWPPHLLLHLQWALQPPPPPGPPSSCTSSTTGWGFRGGAGG